MTELAYLRDMSSAYMRIFRARVTALPPGAVVLDRTYFYPAGGGQPADRGKLTADSGAERSVTDVTKSGNAVLHRLKRSTRGEAVGFQLGEELQGEIDWSRRYRCMRSHTAQHLISAFAFEIDHLRTRRASMSPTEGWIELENPWGHADRWNQLISAVKVAVNEPHDVRVRYVPRAEFEKARSARSGLVPLPPQLDPIRVIEIEGIDVCPCGGTHVRSTAEIGEVRFPVTPELSGFGSKIRFTLDESAPTTPSA